MSRFDENVADSNVNTKLLEKEFNISNTPRNQEEQIQQFEEMRETLDEASNLPDPDNILHDNIQRANRILDQAEEELREGGLSARMVEVCAQMINAITSAANSIVGTSYDDEMELKREKLELEKKKLAIKQATQSLPEGENKNTTINAIVTDRESLLKMISEAKEEKNVVEVEDQG